VIVVRDEDEDEDAKLRLGSVCESMSWNEGDEVPI